MAMDQEQGQKSRVTVNIRGRDYTVRAAASPEYILKLAAYVDEKMKKIEEKNKLLSPYKVAVLAALNIADDLAKLQKDYDDLVKMIEEAKKAGSVNE
ncbi:hypothetical protein Moth_1749 [Calderihabitans maritimus]|uniref:Cell division protein ZapA n=1 Tax=Calderihabitans maritimus TaxID=1246530 RepID=A0A1Z5HSL1_9FIRM|nr:hypothetical protein Moth_1749 [Calderihabitans maritimus]